MGGLLWLQWPYDNALIQGIAGYNLPVMEHGQTEGLSLGVCSQICLETERINGGYKGFDCVYRRAGNGCILCDVTSGKYNTFEYKLP